ncbi:calcium:cation antiporter [Sphaerisporangium rhizosphaerae]|uniref:Calcium:proton antiporter n=1 Tax=Sphaerisporangium rhizosphaerae TaxID=2269375 RepID=A0ABW2P5A6_9ACTN
MNTPPVAATTARSPLDLTAAIVPIVAVLALVAVWGRDLPAIVEVVVVALLAASVLAAVHHAEAVAHRVGEPFGSLVLAVAVTIIEVGLIITLMISGGPATAALARDTVFAAVMITCNGIVGLSLLIVTLRSRTARFNPEGTGAALATVITLATLCLVLPAFTTSAPGPEFSTPQLAFAAVASLVLYSLFVFVQNVRHRESFLTATTAVAPSAAPAPSAPPAPPAARPAPPAPAAPAAPPVPARAPEGARSTGEPPTGERPPGERPSGEPPSGEPPAAPIVPGAGSQGSEGPKGSGGPVVQAAGAPLISLALLMAALVAVVGLAKVESGTIEHTVAAAGLPHSVVGVVIALLVLLPETLAAARNARRDRVQISLNLALGSAMASIGLTIPAIAVASIWLGGPLLLGLGATQIVLLALTAGVGILTVMPGRATLLQAAVHLALCAAYLFLAANP